MTPEDRDRALEGFQQTLDLLQEAQFTLTLFVSGASITSADAIANVRDICDAHLSGRHRLDIVDLHQEPAMAREHNVLATPTLLKSHPTPVRVLVGDMSDHAKILVALDVRDAGARHAPAA
jgi:circadian clock protein KaiB